MVQTHLVPDIAEGWSWGETSLKKVCHFLDLLLTSELLAFYAAVDNAINQLLATQNPNSTAPN